MPRSEALCNITLFNKFKELSRNGTYAVNFSMAGDTLKVMLVTASYSPNIDTHDYKNDVTSEVTGSNYTAGGATLAGKTFTLDTANDRVKFDADNVTWAQHVSGFNTARYGILYKDTGTPSDSPLIAYLDLGSDRGNVSGDLTLNWNTDGIRWFS